MACRMPGEEGTPGSHLGIHTSRREKMAKVRLEYRTCGRESGGGVVIIIGVIIILLLHK